MEDSHIAHGSVGEEDIHLFGVFDGHGGMHITNNVDIGKEVAVFI